MSQPLDPIDTMATRAFEGYVQGPGPLVSAGACHSSCVSFRQAPHQQGVRSDERQKIDVGKQREVAIVGQERAHAVFKAEGRDLCIEDQIAGDA